MAHTNKIESPSGTEHGRREMLHSGYSPAPGWTQLKSWHALPDFLVSLKSHRSFRSVSMTSVRASIVPVSDNLSSLFFFTSIFDSFYFYLY